MTTAEKIASIYHANRNFRVETAKCLETAKALGLKVPKPLGEETSIEWLIRVQPRVKQQFLGQSDTCDYIFADRSCIRVSNFMWSVMR